MGACCGHICPIEKLRRFPRRKSYCDGTSLVEFETLIDEKSKAYVEPRYPGNRSALASCTRQVVSTHEKVLVLTGRYSILVEEQKRSDAEIALQLQRDEQALELEEEAAIEARREASRVAMLAQSPSEIINPAKLVFSTDNPQSWLGSDAHNWNIAGMSDIESPRDDMQVNRPLLSGSAYSSLITNSTVSSLSKDAMTIGSTPPSSVDLEWENEAGLTPPLQFPSTVDDDMASITVTDTASNQSRRSTPASNENELEWDGDFTSTQITQLDTETEQLINEIERMTENALKDMNSNR